MPKIVIKEYDQTTAGSTLQNNFSVVVPGYVAEGKGISCFDENGIYECQSVAAFEENIGKVENSTEVQAKGPTLTKFKPAGATEETQEVTHGKMTANDFYREYYGCTYTRTPITEASKKVAGYLVGQDGTDWYKYTKAESWAADTEYSYIKSGDEGVDAKAGTYQIGNQIAHKLLNLGYTVLYLKIDDEERKINTSTIWEPLKDRSIYDFRYLVSGMLDDISTDITVASVNDIIKGIASNNNKTLTDSDGRGDCIALLDIAKSRYSGKTSSEAVTAIKNNLPAADQYCAVFAPTVIYNKIDSYNNVEFPASFHYLACAANAFSRYSEWYAVAGYQRGISALSILGTSAKFGEAAINALQARNGAGGCAVNLVVKLKDAYYLWGNRTGFALSSELVASHFLNIRQLCCTLKKSIYETCRHLTFDPNSDILWLNFCNAIRPLLEKMKTDQGIRDYRFERKETSKKGKLFAAIRIIPIEAVEDFEIGVSLEDDFSKTTVVINELL